MDRYSHPATNFLLSAIMLTIVSACASDNTEDLLNQYYFTDSLANRVPVIRVVDPENGDSVERPFQIAYNIQNWEVEDSGRHLQYFLNRENRGAIFNTSSFAINQIDTGWQTIHLQLAHSDFKRIPVIDSVRIYVQPPPPETFVLIVNNGSGTGNYKVGVEITIRATDQAGKIFDRWTGDIEHLEAPDQKVTRVVMPSKSIELTAQFSEEPVDFINEVFPIINDYCLSCHTSTYNPVLSTCQDIMANAQLVRQKINDTTDPMPPSGLMSDEKITFIEKWIDQGTSCN